MSDIKLIIVKSVDDEFLIKLQHLFNEYGYQLPMESEEDTSLSFFDLYGNKIEIWEDYEYDAR